MRFNQPSYSQAGMGSVPNYYPFNVAALASMSNQQLEVSNELHMFFTFLQPSHYCDIRPRAMTAVSKKNPDALRSLCKDIVLPFLILSFPRSRFAGFD